MPAQPGLRIRHRFALEPAKRHHRDLRQLTVASNITASAQGSWNATFVIPASPAGNHTIDAFGATTKASSVSDAVFRIGAGISADPASGNVGTKTTISGSGFPANTVLIIKYDDKEIARGLNTDATGSFGQSVTIPKSAAGNHIIKVVDPKRRV
jgi:hypothetical protein